MNITQIEIIIDHLGDDASDFLEALADAETALEAAIDLLSSHDRVTLRELVGASETVSEVLGLVESVGNGGDDDA